MRMRMMMRMMMRRRRGLVIKMATKIVLVVMKLPNWCNIGMMRRRRWSKKIETVTKTVLVVVIMNSFVESIVFQGN